MYQHYLTGAQIDHPLLSYEDLSLYMLQKVKEQRRSRNEWGAGRALPQFDAKQEEWVWSLENKYVRYMKRIFGLSWQKYGNCSSADYDELQTAMVDVPFIETIRALYTMNEENIEGLLTRENEMKAFLVNIAKMRCIDFVRRKIRQKKDEEQSDDSERIQQHSRRTFILEWLEDENNVSSEDRQLMFSVFAEGNTYEEALAEQCVQADKKAAGAARQRIQKIKNRLEAALRDYDEKNGTKGPYPTRNKKSTDMKEPISSAADGKRK